MRSFIRRRLSRSDSVRIGVLGVGNIGSVHLKSALAMPGVDVVAAADTVPKNRDRADSAGVTRVYDDYVTLLESETLDVAIVALPPFLHCDAVEVAAETGVDVFVEKPFARSTAEADEMLEAASEAGIRVGVDHTLRYQPDLTGLKGAYEDGTVGHVPHASMVRVNDGPLGRPPVEDAPPAWPLDPDATGGGSLMELGVHCFDYLEWTFGPLEIRDAMIDTTLEVPVEDAATVLMEARETGTAVTLHCGSYQWEELPEVNTNVRLEGITGTIESEEYLPTNFYGSAALSALSNVASRFTGGDPAVYGPTFYLQAHYDALFDFVDSIRADETPPVTGEDGRRTLELVETAYELADEDCAEADALEVVS
ncbi:Gfo/Idh/MocA family oxidoreductase [Halostagnicola sp. A-GB9-2]|uniref:Gfo/Idh/MocA family protein n=1 Tax=Halostagnicola sp. A-GB9-2 TaxID=3048066 RepID=UPI0024BF8C50|nr:Gfo/Idh/MocA family oxidoreductase [Halostagnicola sp. A-GB9-2]MDJ1434515.1 Gfo/Idh/MocA family oxidoreductase [Halostagnicola sp. A-GB9-2]